MELTIEFDREDDGRWITEVDAIPGAMVYGSTKAEAEAKITVLVLRVLGSSKVANLF